MRVVLFGRGGSVGTVLAPSLIDAGHEIVDDLTDCDAAIDFTAPEVVEEHVVKCVNEGVPVIVDTTGWNVTAVDEAARSKGVAVFHAPNFRWALQP